MSSPNENWIITDTLLIRKYCSDITISLQCKTRLFGNETLELSLPDFVERIQTLNPGGFMQRVIALAEEQCNDRINVEEVRKLIQEGIRASDSYDRSNHKQKHLLVGRYDIDAAALDFVEIMSNALAEFKVKASLTPFDLTEVFTRCKTVIDNLITFDEVLFNEVYNK